jgi:hypothetical protein
MMNDSSFECDSDSDGWHARAAGGPPAALDSVTTLMIMSLVTRTRTEFPSPAAAPAQDERLRPLEFHSN